MIKSQELLPGTWLITLDEFRDQRGSFVKTYSQKIFQALGLNFNFGEEFYSSSNKNVVRGMHFQIPPFDHEKIVYCPSGSVMDVLLDLRRGPSFGKFTSVLLSYSEPALLFIPKGIAHGFKSLENNSLMVYKTSTEHQPTHDLGILWNSFGFDWKCNEPIVSGRDNSHVTFDQFSSPF